MNFSTEKLKDALERIVERKSIPWRMIIDEGILLDPETRRVLVINEVGGKIWSLIDGQRTVAQIVDGILQEYDAPREQVEADVMAFLKQMMEYGLVSFKSR